MLRRSPFSNQTASEGTIAKNDKVRRALASHGDNGTAPRHVMHFVFESDGRYPREEAADLLRTFGFEVDLNKSVSGLIAEEHREVASADFDGLTQALADLAESWGWTYDGFECAVEVHN